MSREAKGTAFKRAARALSTITKNLLCALIWIWFVFRLAWKPFPLAARDLPGGSYTAYALLSIGVLAVLFHDRPWGLGFWIRQGFRLLFLPLIVVWYAFRMPFYVHSWSSRTLRSLNRWIIGNTATQVLVRLTGCGKTLT